jgi:hypothetical protein
MPPARASLASVAKRRTPMISPIKLPAAGGPKPGPAHTSRRATLVVHFFDNNAQPGSHSGQVVQVPDKSLSRAPTTERDHLVPDGGLRQLIGRHVELENRVLCSSAGRSASPPVTRRAADKDPGNGRRDGEPGRE